MATKPPTIAMSPRGLTQEEALTQLQQHPDFKVGSVVASIRPQGDRWAIKLLEPKTAEFPPKADDDEDSEEDTPKIPELPGEDSDEDSSDSDDEGPSGDGDSPFGKEDGEGEDKGPEAKDEKGQLIEALGLLHAIADKLGIGGPADDLLGPDGPPPPPGGPDAGPPAHKAPAGPGAAPKSPGRPLRPGEAPPGSTPVGAPAFASVAEMAQHVPSFTASASAEGTTIKQAHSELQAEYGPHYKVGQIKRDGDKLHALLSVR